MTPSKRSSAKRCLRVISTLANHVDTGFFCCALNAWTTKNIYEKLDLEQRLWCT